MKNDLNHKLKVENRGYEYLFTYEVGDLTIDKDIKINTSKFKIIRVKCPYCGKEYDVRASGFINAKQNCSYCCNKYENSFAYYIQQELKEPLNKYWDWDKNTVNPYCISKKRGSKSKKFGNTKIWINCTKKYYHGSYETTCASFCSGKRCSYCVNHKVHPKDSFAQYCIDNIDKHFMDKYWGDKNTIDPFSISPKASSKKVWIKCINMDYHDEYLITPSKFSDGGRCPYCTKREGSVHRLDSFGTICKDKLKHWSKNNKVSPFEISPRSGVERLFICQECGEEFKRTPHTLWNCDDVRCLECSKSKGEKFIEELLEKYKIEYEYQKTFDNLRGLCGGLLSYDFYLPEYNTLIEYQGNFHDGTAPQQSHKEFLRQQEHDRRKKKYAKSIGVKLLEIWYWDFDNIEKILMNEINKMNRG